MWLHLDSQAKKDNKKTANETWFDGHRSSHLTWLAAKRQETEESASDRFCYSCNGHRPIISAQLKWESLLSYKFPFYQNTSEPWSLHWYSNPSLASKGFMGNGGRKCLKPERIYASCLTPGVKNSVWDCGRIVEDIHLDCPNISSTCLSLGNNGEIFNQNKVFYFLVFRSLAGEGFFYLFFSKSGWWRLTHHFHFHWAL